MKRIPSPPPASSPTHRRRTEHDSMCAPCQVEVGRLSFSSPSAKTLLTIPRLASTVQPGEGSKGGCWYRRILRSLWNSERCRRAVLRQLWKGPETRRVPPPDGGRHRTSSGTTSSRCGQSEIWPAGTLLHRARCSCGGHRDARAL